MPKQQLTAESLLRGKVSTSPIKHRSSGMIQHSSLGGEIAFLLPSRASEFVCVSQEDLNASLLFLSAPRLDQWLCRRCALRRASPRQRGDRLTGRCRSCCTPRGPGSPAASARRRGWCPGRKEERTKHVTQRGSNNGDDLSWLSPSRTHRC